jgi:hypothetical protein
MDFPQTHHTNDGRPVLVDRQGDGALTFTDGDAELARLVPDGGAWRLTLRDGEQRTLPGSGDEPPIADTMVEIDLHFDEDDDTSGLED